MTAAVVNGNPQARVWLFDFDNTLSALEKQVDWAASRRELESFLRAEGIDEAIFREFPSRNLPLYNALLMRRLDGSRNVTELMRQASAIIESYELRGVEHADPLPGAIELLFALHARNKHIAIVTSNSSRTVTCWLARHHLTLEVGTIVGRDSLLPLKPAPEMVRRALELSHGSAPEAILIGDSEADLHAAHRADVGFFGIAANLDARTRLKALGAREIFSSPGELARHLSLSGFPPKNIDERRLR
ncbi:MAG: HAD family hydrolase [Deltaproteobacteria bacterium]|nr:HAD family hydrolase [Deltaproteobacteria bacterium]